LEYFNGLIAAADLENMAIVYKNGTFEINVHQT